jgi:GNAT superfamily N-acetyltransferase
MIEPSRWLPAGPNSVRAILTPSELPALEVPDLSEWFNPFLRHFMEESLRAGGEVLLALEGLTVRGILLVDATERTGSIFTRSPEVARELYREKGPLPVFSELPLGPVRENYDIMSVELPGSGTSYRFAHPVRAAREEDLESLRRLFAKVYGRVNERWLLPGSPSSEKCFVVEDTGEVVGAAWLTAVGRHGRLHSLTVLPRYRRLGIGSDLFHARMIWAGRLGLVRVISEIPETNRPSRSIAAKGGMRPVAQMFLFSQL